MVYMVHINIIMFIWGPSHTRSKTLNKVETTSMGRTDSHSEQMSKKKLHCSSLLHLEFLDFMRFFSEAKVENLVIYLTHIKIYLACIGDAGLWLVSG